MGQRLVAIVWTCILGCAGLTVSGAEPVRLSASSRKVLASFVSGLDQSPESFLERNSIAPPDEAWRARVLASLPPKGNLTPSTSDLAKINTAERLDYTARRRVVFKVIDVDQAFVGLYFRTVVLVSARALAILDGEEFAALVAHELGHEADADAYQAAITRHDNTEMRELELKADGLAVLTLRHAGVDPERLVSAIRIVMRYNDWSDRKTGNETTRTGGFTDARYVPVEERIAFIRAVASLRWAQPETAPRDTAAGGSLSERRARHRKSRRPTGRSGEVASFLPDLLNSR